MPGLIPSYASLISHINVSNLLLLAISSFPEAEFVLEPLS